MRIAFIVFSLVFASLGANAANTNAAKTKAANKNSAVKEWTFLVYLNGNNSLDSFGPYNINEMEKVGSTDQLNVVVEWASQSAGDVKRLYIQKDNDENNVTSPVVQDLGKVDMGDYNSLVDFVKWGVQNYPAKKYFINVWNHGGGWHFQSLGHGFTRSFARGFHRRFDLMSRFGFEGSPGDLSPMDISWDDTTGHFISTTQLGVALNESAQIIGHKVDLYGSDACLMAMPEVATEMADSVSVYAGSEETEPGAGWPYTEFLQDWTKNPTATAAQVATYLTNDYAKSYSNGSHGTQDVTFSSFDMSKAAEFNSAMKDFGAALRALNSDGVTKATQALSQTRVFTYSDYADIVDFTAHIKAAGVNGVDRSADDLTAAANDFVIANATTGAFEKVAHGVSVWIPSDTGTYSQYLERYKQLKFENATSWAEAVGHLLGN